MQENVSANISFWIYDCGIVQSQNIKTCRLCHLLPAGYVPTFTLSKMMDWQSGRTSFLLLCKWVAKYKDSAWQGKQMLVEVTSSLSHGIIRSTASLAQAGDPPHHPTRPNRTQQTCSNQKENPNPPLEKGKKIEATGSLKLGNLCQVQSFSRLPALPEPEVINLCIKRV